MPDGVGATGKRRVTAIGIAALLCGSLFSFSAPGQLQWSQQPGFMVDTNVPDGRGGDRGSSFTWPGQPAETNIALGSAVGDDFLSDGQRITRIRWWGSYSPGFGPVSATSFFEDAYVLSFFSALPEDNAQGVPLGLLATYVAPIQHINISPTSFTGADGHPIFEYELSIDRSCLEFSGSDQVDIHGFRGRHARRYWLTIQAEVGREFRFTTNATGEAVWTRQFTGKQTTSDFWGWHTSPTSREATSVSGEARLFGTNLVFPRSSWRTNDLLHGDLAQAFELWTACDSEPPRVVSVEAFCSYSLIRIEFNEEMRVEDLIDTFYYIVYYSDREVAHVNQIIPELNQRVAWMEVERSTTPLPRDQLLSVYLVGPIRDLCDNYIAYDTRAVFDCGPSVLPALTAAWSQLPSSILSSNAAPSGGIRLSELSFVASTNEVIADDFRATLPIRGLRWWGTYPSGVQPGFEDGHVIAFFAGDLGALRHPANPLAVYITPKLRGIPTGHFDVNLNSIFRYETDLADALLVQNQGAEGGAYSFVPTSNSVYWVSISAQIGRTVAPIYSNEFRVGWAAYPSGRSATNHFWGWLTSPVQNEALSVNGSALPAGNNWIYPPESWETNTPAAGETHQAFELLSLLGRCDPIRLNSHVPATGLLAFWWDSADYILEVADSPAGPWRLAATASPYSAVTWQSRRFYRLACAVAR